MSPRFLDGMVLAATAADDRAGAAGVVGLSSALGTALEAAMTEMAALDRSARRARVHRLTAALRAVPTDASPPPAVRALLAVDMPPEIGRAWAASAAPVRRGFRLGAALRATLRRLAAPTTEGAEAAERAAAAELTERAPERHRERLTVWATRLAVGADPARVLGALVLGAASASPDVASPGVALPGAGLGDGTSRPWRRIGRELGLAWALTEADRWRA